MQMGWGEGGVHPDPEIRGGSLQKKQFGLKIRGESGPPPPTPPGSATVSTRLWVTGNMSGFESYINRSEVLFSAVASANFPTISKRNAELQVTIDITG